VTRALCPADEAEAEAVDDVDDVDDGVYRRVMPVPSSSQQPWCWSLRRMILAGPCVICRARPAAVQHDTQRHTYRRGSYNGGCPIHLKRAPEVERRRRRGGWSLGRGLCQPLSPEHFCISHIKMVSFYACFENMFFSKKDTLIKREGVRTPWTLPLDPPLIYHDNMIS